jgi:hypothetical protein
MKDIDFKNLAGKFGLRITRNECGDLIILGNLGHLYPGDGLCAMAIDGKPTHQSRWDALGGKLWMGDISAGETGRKVQDVKIERIRLGNARAAIKMVGARPKRVLSPSALQASKGRMLKARESLSASLFPALETIVEVHLAGS